MFSIEQKVLFRGKYSKMFSNRGVIEDHCLGMYLVRLENGNAKWADEDQLKEA